MPPRYSRARKFIGKEDLFPPGGRAGVYHFAVRNHFPASPMTRVEDRRSVPAEAIA